MSENIKTVEELDRELRGTQEMLFMVLDVIGTPVIVDVDKAKAKMTNDRQISCMQNSHGHFVFSVSDKE